MKNKLKILLFLSLFINVVLGFLVFPKNQIRFNNLMKQLTILRTDDKLPIFSSLVLLHEFNPISQFKAEDTRIFKLPSFPVIETHGHLGQFFKTTPENISNQLTTLGIKTFINLSFTTGEDFIKLKSNYSDPRIIHFSTFNWKRLEEENSIQLMLSDLKKDISNGTRGIKLWKNFGLLLKKNGNRLKINDPELDVLFEECEKAGLIISIHTADPAAFFAPINEKNERYEELLRHPEWSFHSSEFPSLEEVLSERNERFKRHPKLKFIALHFAEYANELEKAEKLLLDFPNVSVDIAARIDELGRHPKSTRDFFEKFSDRILFGIDGPPDHGKLEIYSRFLETSDEYFDYYPAHKPRKGFWKIYGLGLNKSVLEKIYYKNAEKLLKIESK